MKKTKVKSTTATSKSRSRPAKSGDGDRGEVFFLSTSKGLFPATILKAAETPSRAASKQLKQQARWLSDQGLVQHPYDVSGMLYLMDNSSYLDACVRQIAQDVVGQGWKIKAKANVAKPEEKKKKRPMTPEEEDRREIEEEIAKITREYPGRKKKKQEDWEDEDEGKVFISDV
jgi:hypothetical protein